MTIQTKTTTGKQKYLEVFLENSQTKNDISNVICLGDFPKGRI